MARPQVNGTGQVIRLRRRGFWLEYASMAWMTAEAAVAITAGVIASSVALVGFVPVANGQPRVTFCPGDSLESTTQDGFTGEAIR